MGSDGVVVQPNPLGDLARIQSFGRCSKDLEDPHPARRAQGSMSPSGRIGPEALLNAVIPHSSVVYPTYDIIISQSRRTWRERTTNSTEAAITAITAHHEEIGQELERKVEDLLKTVENGEIHTRALASVVDYVFTTLLRHAEVEEATLYAAATRIGLEPVVSALTADHVLLRADAQALRAELSAVRAAAFTRSLARVFESHARMENELVLPALARSPQVDLPTMLKAMGGHIEHGPSGSSETTSERANDDMLDVRDDPPSLRHRRIFERFESLAEGRSFVLVNDHDPKPLFYQFQAEQLGTFTWTYLEEGPEVWRVQIGRTAPRMDP